MYALLENDSGLTGIEHASNAVLIAVAIIVSATVAGRSPDAAIADISATIEGIATENAEGGNGGGEHGGGDEDEEA